MSNDHIAQKTMQRHQLIVKTFFVKLRMNSKIAQAHFGGSHNLSQFQLVY